MTTALQTCYDINADWQLLFLCSKGNFLQKLLSQWAGVIMCLPSKLHQISNDSDQVNGKLKHDSTVALFPRVR
jgi:hypothetical protein